MSLIVQQSYQKLRRSSLFSVTFKLANIISVTNHIIQAGSENYLSMTSHSNNYFLEIMSNVAHSEWTGLQLCIDNMN